MMEPSPKYNGTMNSSGSPSHLLKMVYMKHHIFELFGHTIVVLILLFVGGGLVLLTDPARTKEAKLKLLHQRRHSRQLAFTKNNN